MTEQPDNSTRDIAEDGTQENAQTGTGGGRSSYGPPTSGGGEQQPGGEVPPYGGRQDSGEVDSDGSDYRDGARVGGATGPVESSPDSASPDPGESPGGATGSPADEQPAGDQPSARDGDDSRDDPGVGPAHMPDTKRGEDYGTSGGGS